MFIATGAIGGSTFPNIVGVVATGSNGNNTSHTFTYPSSTTAAGELLIAVLCSTGLWTTPSGWSALIDSTFSPHGTAFYKVADGSEGASLSATNSGSAPAAGVIYRLTKYRGTPEATVASGSGANPDPPLLTSSWGAKKTLWIAIDCSLVNFNTLSFSSYPLGFGNGVNATGSTGGGGTALAAAASLADAVASKNPGTFATSGSGSSTWAALTIGVRGS